MALHILTHCHNVVGEGDGEDGSLKEKEADMVMESIEMSALTRAVSMISERINKHCK